jgi:hypothetical protein
MPRHDHQCASYEEWVLMRIRGDHHGFCLVAQLMNTPNYLYPPMEQPSFYDLENKLRVMRDAGQIRFQGKRCFLVK